MDCDLDRSDLVFWDGDRWVHLQDEAAEATLRPDQIASFVDVRPHRDHVPGKHGQS